MSLLKKVAAAAAAAVMTFSLASCGSDTTWGADIDGTRLRAGILIYFQSNAVSEASQYLVEGETDVLAITIEDKPSKDWINDEAVEDMREYAAVEKKFAELELSFENNEEKAVSNTVDQWWEYVGEYFEGIGVSKQSYYDIVLNSEKRSLIFDHYYADGGEKAVSDDEIKDYLLENNARIKFIRMELRDGEGNLLKSDGKDELRKMAEGYIERAKGGESFEAIEDEYNEYYANLIAEATGTSDETSSDGGTDVAADTGEETERISYGTVVSRGGVIPSEKVAETVFDGTLNAGDYTIVEENEEWYIVYRMDLFDDPSYLEDQRDSVRRSLKGDEFDETVLGWIEGQNCTVNEAAIKRYKLEKLTLE
ncbi:MAG: hypothetical protein NC395_03375 [Prevotella sp.]|nr:hypothetical protein [Prevotella sp.]